MVFLRVWVFDLFYGGVFGGGVDDFFKLKKNSKSSILNMDKGVWYEKMIFWSPKAKMLFYDHDF